VCRTGQRQPACRSDHRAERRLKRRSPGGRAAGPAPGQSLTCTLSLGADHPTNPFLHRFHPDHDNLDELGAPLAANAKEAYAVTRELTLSVAAADPQGADGQPRYDWGVSRLEGSWSEVLTGVHKHPIRLAGTFQLERASNVDVLNQ
jgi:hypothetical protein